MSGEALLRWPDLGVIGFNFLLLVGIGIYCSRKNVSAEAYFLANRSMPGWVVGVSLMATLISSMTSLAIPAFTYVEDWRYMPAQFTYLIAVWLAVLFFMPLFRRGHVRSAYEYLELRFGTWARLYAAGVFVLFQMFRLSVILYAVCLPIETMSSISLPWIILFLRDRGGHLYHRGRLGSGHLDRFDSRNRPHGGRADLPSDHHWSSPRGRRSADKRSHRGWEIFGGQYGF